LQASGMHKPQGDFIIRRLRELYFEVLGKITDKNYETLKYGFDGNLTHVIVGGTDQQIKSVGKHLAGVVAARCGDLRQRVNDNHLMYKYVPAFLTQQEFITGTDMDHLNAQNLLLDLVQRYVVTCALTQVSSQAKIVRSHASKVAEFVSQKVTDMKMDISSKIKKHVQELVDAAEAKLKKAGQIINFQHVDVVEA